MWGSDFPHPAGIWRDSCEYIARKMAGLRAGVRRKTICDNTACLDNFAA